MRVVTFLVAAAVIIASLFGGWWVLSNLGEVLTTLDKSVIAALVTVTGVAIGTIWVKHVEHRHSVEADFRKEKVTLYRGFVEMFDNVSAGKVSNLARELKKWKRELLFWGSPEVIRLFHQLSSLATSDDQSVSDLAASTNIIGGLLLAMRKDVGLSNRAIVKAVVGVPRGTVFGSRHIMRNPDLFLLKLKEDPNLLVSELAALEKQLS